jgi:hypothetical protein
MDLIFGFGFHLITLNKSLHATLPASLHSTITVMWTGFIYLTYLTVLTDLELIRVHILRIHNCYCACPCRGNPWFLFPTGKMEDFLAPRLDAHTFVLFMQMRQKGGSGTTGRPITGVNKISNHSCSAILVLTKMRKLQLRI